MSTSRIYQTVAEKDILEQSGQPIVVWSCVLLLWITMRVGASSFAEDNGTPLVSRPITQARMALTDAGIARGHVQKLDDITKSWPNHASWEPAMTAGLHTLTLGKAPKEVALPNRQKYRPVKQQTSPNKIGPSKEIVLSHFAEPASAKLLSNNAPVSKSWQVYTYSFWRFAKSNQASLAAAGQYGGSQTGVVVTHRLRSLGAGELSLFGRAVISPGISQSQEFAAGLSMQLSRKLPVRLIAEHRLRSDARDVSAFYMTGSLEGQRLLGKLMLSGFGQAGVVHDAGAIDGKITGFLDAGIRAEQKLLNAKPLQLSIGAGAWAGGQRGKYAGSQRLDIGPTIRLDTDFSGQPVRLHADWRFRIAGNAEPGSGPALTLSTGF
jgi:hypothetical protein